MGGDDVEVVEHFNEEGKRNGSSSLNDRLRKGGHVRRRSVLPIIWA